jgi:hypothetical protein
MLLIMTQNHGNFNEWFALSGLELSFLESDGREPYSAAAGERTIWPSGHDQETDRVRTSEKWLQ